MTLAAHTFWLVRPYAAALPLPLMRGAGAAPWEAETLSPAIASRLEARPGASVLASGGCLP